MDCMYFLVSLFEYTSFNFLSKCSATAAEIILLVVLVEVLCFLQEPPYKYAILSAHQYELG